MLMLPAPFLLRPDTKKNNTKKGPQPKPRAGRTKMTASKKTASEEDEPIEETPFQQASPESENEGRQQPAPAPHAEGTRGHLPEAQ